MNVTECSEEQEKIPMPLTCESAAINECRVCLRLHPAFTSA